MATAVVAVALAVGGCGGGSTTSSEPNAATGSSAVTANPAVKIVNFTYRPADVTVDAGTRIKFTNDDTTPHTVTSKNSEAFETGPIDQGQTKSIVLDKPGTYAYYCVFHPFMKGTITVK
jgi:plastocyanin